VSLLKKFKEPFTKCNVSAETSLTQEHPVIFKEVHLLFDVQGASELKPEQLLKAVNLSMTKYCGVSAMIAKAAPIYYKVNINGSEVGSGQAFA
nr:OsmC family peroxiredoxin [Pseudobdellovibrionaceae bacterium]